ncbi:transcription factor Adf-1-like [Ornithodoros turicata]|uniref:transcription factor Adf-1-like n=1 Tax=Ornithodoros turicata TaxID=34597 RepID=UPI0031395EFC
MAAIATAAAYKQEHMCRPCIDVDRHSVAPVRGSAKLEFNEKLIHEVEKRKPLWEVCSAQYKNATLKHHLWNEVAAVLEVPVDDCRKRCEGLRDTFKRHFKTFKTSGRSGDGADDAVAITWPFFKTLLFLKDSVELRRGSGNCPAPEAQTLQLDFTQPQMTPDPSSSVSAAETIFREIHTAEFMNRPRLKRVEESAAPPPEGP